MEIVIHDNQAISSISEQFSRAFPYLKLEFYTKARSTYKGALLNSIQSTEKTLAEFRATNNVRTLTLNDAMTVSDLERGFLSVYNLVVQVLRKSGKVWLETTLTDGWTLHEQNKQGEDLSKNCYSTEL